MTTWQGNTLMLMWKVDGSGGIVGVNMQSGSEGGPGKWTQIGWTRFVLRLANAMTLLKGH